MRYFNGFKFGKIILVLFLSLCLRAQAQQTDLIERNFAGSSKESTPQSAKVDIQNQAAQKASEDLIRDIIGEERFLKNKTLIQNKIIKNSARYIPFSKPSNITQEGPEYKMSVQMKISVRDVRQILQDIGLLNEEDSIPVVLPMVSILDRYQGNSYRWWLSDEKNKVGFLIKQGRTLEDSLRLAFQNKNFYVIKPIESGLGSNIPSHYLSERVNNDGEQFFSQYFNAPILIEGQVLINKDEKSPAYAVDIKLSAIQVSNQRPVADVSRHFVTQVGNFESVVDKKIKDSMDTVASDLAAQVFEAWQRGSIGTSLIKLTIQGSRNLQMLEMVKEKIRAEMTQVKNIRERLIGSDLVSFEVDMSSTNSEFIKKIEGLDFNGKKLIKVSEKPDEVVAKFAN